MSRPPKLRSHLWDGEELAPGQSRDLFIRVSESYSGMMIKIPVHVRRGRDEGPAIFVTAAVHGNEINGTGAIRELVQDRSLQLDRGTLILVPVVNILGFDRHSRYLPDRRDLNRCFPGSSRGTLASRLARVVFEEIVGRCDYGIDLHTAAVRRTNFPNVRADTSDSAIRRLAEAFGCEIIIDSKGPKGSLRREASAAGCPTIILEAGEVWKVEPAIVETAVRGIRNVLLQLEMLPGEPVAPPYRRLIRKTSWVRAERGGFLEFHVAPGELVERGVPVATVTSLLGREKSHLAAPFRGVVLGMTTLPATRPGEPVCHLGKLGTATAEIRRARRALADEDLHERLLDDLASNVKVVDPGQLPPGPASPKRKAPAKDGGRRK